LFGLVFEAAVHIWNPSPSYANRGEDIVAFQDWLRPVVLEWDRIAYLFWSGDEEESW
jgi:hypothetical protein